MSDADDTCTKCNGTGHLPQFNHVEGGTCFRCEGTGLKRHEANSEPERTQPRRAVTPLEKAETQLAGLRRQYRAIQAALTATPDSAVRRDLKAKLKTTVEEGTSLANKVAELRAHRG